MTLIPTPGLLIPTIPLVAIPPVYQGTLLIDATGEKVALMGRFWNKDRATKNITKIGLRFGAVTKAGGSGLTVSLQDVSLTTGPPTQPDETQDQTVAVAAASITANTWLQTGALSATRTVAFGELLAVVIEFDGGGRLGSDSFVISSFSTAATARIIHDGMSSLKSGAGPTWATNLSNGVQVILECDDGTFGTLNAPGVSGNFPSSAITTTSFQVNSAADELALRFSLPFTCAIDGVWIAANVSGSTPADVVLYQGTSALATVSFDANTLASNVNGLFWAMFPEITITPSTEYFLALKPTSTNTIDVYDLTVSSAAHFQAWPGGINFYFASRVDAGSWTTVTTRRLLAGLSISKIDDGMGTPPPTYRIGI